ncbi:Hypothetical predicted protein, partial [Marmota monax]
FSSELMEPVESQVLVGTGCGKLQVPSRDTNTLLQVPGLLKREHPENSEPPSFTRKPRFGGKDWEQSQPEDVSLSKLEGHIQDGST